MRKSNFVILRKMTSVLLCLAVCVGFLAPLSVKKAKAALASSNGIFLVDASLTLWDDGKIGMNLYFSGMNDAGVSRGSVKVNGESYAISKKDSRGLYYITYYVDARDILASRSIKVYDGTKQVSLSNTDAVYGTVTVSGEDYLNRCIALLGNDKKADIIKALKIYGGCAENWFYHTGNSYPSQVLKADLSAFEAVVTGSLPDGVSYYGSSLILDESITIRHYFSVAGDPGQFTATVNNVPLNGGYQESSGLFYLDIPNIRLSDISTMYTLNVKWGNNRQFSLGYSAMTYAALVAYQDSGSDLKALVQSMYWLDCAIKEYLGGTGSEDPGTIPDDTGITFENYQEYMKSKYPDVMPEAVIIIPAAATVEEKYAAKLLQTYILAENGYQPEIVLDSEKNVAGKYEISVGNTNRYHGVAKYSSNDSYSIKSYGVKPSGIDSTENKKGVSITGAGALGLIHGTMRFLEACGGYFYMSWDDGMMSYQDYFKVDLKNGIDIDYERAFVFTDIDVNYGWGGADQTIDDLVYIEQTKDDEYPVIYTGRLFSMAFGLNGYFADQVVYGKSVGGERWYLTGAKGTKYVDKEGRYTEGAVGLLAGQAHTLTSEFIPASKYYNSHKDWFATAIYSWDDPITDDSKRERTPEQLCKYTMLHDSEAYNLILQYCKDIIAKEYDPDAPMQIISLSNNDGNKFCTCSKCLANREAHHAEGDCEAVEMIQLLNQLCIDLDIENKYPNLYLDTLAYTWTIKSPGDVKCNSHIIVRWAPIEGNYGNTVDSDDIRNSEYYPYLLGWLKACEHVWIWDYNSNWQTTIAPYANVDVFQYNIKLYKELGIEGVYLQSNSSMNSSNTEFGDIRNFVLGRILQDPSRNYQDELAFYTYAFYGSCGAYVREYMSILEEQCGNHYQNTDYRDQETKYRSFMYEVYGGIHSFNSKAGVKDTAFRMPDKDIGTCEGLWRAINARASGENALVQQRLKKLELSWKLVKSTLNVYEFSNASTYESENTKLRNDIINCGFTTFNLNNGWQMKDCKFLNNHPDNWCIQNDVTVGGYLTRNPGLNLNPTVIMPGE